MVGEKGVPAKDSDIVFGSSQNRCDISVSYLYLHDRRVSYGALQFRVLADSFSLYPEVQWRIAHIPFPIRSLQSPGVVPIHSDSVALLDDYRILLSVYWIDR